MPERPNQRLRLKLTNGSEFEAEGTAEFVAGERQEFMNLQYPPESGGTPGAPTGLQPAWDTLTEVSGPILRLRSKLRGKQAETEASLILLAAARMSLQETQPTASQLTRWLRSSGYPVGRIDRILLELHPDLMREFGGTVDDIVSLLTKAGYRGWCVDHSPEASRRAAYAREVDVESLLQPIGPETSWERWGTWPHTVWAREGVELMRAA